MVEVEVDDDGQQQRVAVAVGEIGRAAEAVGHRVDRAEARVRKGEPGLEARQHHLRARPEVVSALEHRGQMRGDPPNGIDGVHVRDGRGRVGGQRLEGMAQGIHPGRGRQWSIHRQRRLGIDERDVRNDGLADDRELVVRGRVLGIRDDRELGDVRGGPSRRRNEHENGRRRADVIHALVVPDVAPVRGDDTDALRAVHRAAPAHGHDRVAALLRIAPGPHHDLVVAGVGRDLVEHGVLDPRLVERGENVARPAGRLDVGTGDDEGAARAEVARVLAGQMPSAVAEDELRGHELAKLIKGESGHASSRAIGNCAGRVGLYYSIPRPPN